MIKFKRNRIIPITAIIFLMIILIYIFDAYNEATNMKKSAIEQYYNILKATASVMNTNIDQHITHVKSEFQILISKEIHLQKDLLKIVNLGSNFSEISIVDHSGKITVSSNVSEIGSSFPIDTYLRHKEEVEFKQKIFLIETEEDFYFAMCNPYEKGILVTRLNLYHVVNIVSHREGLGESGECLLAYRDKNGDAVFFTDRRFRTEVEARDIIPKKDIHIPITQALLGNEKEFSNFVDYRGIPVFAVTEYIEDLDVGLVVKIDQEEAFKSVSENIKNIWFSTSYIILAIIIIAIVFYFLITGGLKQEIKHKTIELERQLGKSEKQRIANLVILNDLNEATNKMKLEIDERKQAEENLKENEQKLRNIFDNTTNLFYSHNVDHKITYLSPQVEQVLGYTAEEAMKKWTNFVSDNPNNEIAYQSTLKAIETGERQPTYELELVRRDGEKIMVEVRESPIVENGKTVAIVGSLAEITERKQARDKLIQSEKKFKALYDNAPLSYQSLNENGSFRDINPTWLRTLGYEEDEIIGKFYKDFLHPDYKKHFEKNFSTFKESGYVHDVQYKIRHKKGHYLDISFDGCIGYNPDGSFKETYCVFQDITESKQAEEKLIQSEIRYKYLYDQAPVSIWEEDYSKVHKYLQSLKKKGIKDLRNYFEKHHYEVDKCLKMMHVMDINETTVELFHAKNKKELLTHLGSIITKESFSAFIEQLCTIAQNETQYIGESINKTFDGKIITVSINWSVVPGYEKDYSKVLVSLIDITERKRAEKIQKTLFNISNDLNTSDNLHELFNKIREELANILDTTNFYIALYDEKNDLISLPYNADLQDIYETYPAGKTLTNYVIQTGKPLFADTQLIDDLAKQGKIELIGTPSLIWIGVPLKIEDKVIGVIAVQSYDNPELYTTDDMGTLKFVSEEIALAIKHKQAEEQTKKDLQIKTALLQELYHRTKNNMQVISSMLKMQSRNIENLTISADKLTDFLYESFNVIINRIRSMSMVHQKLYQAQDLSHINLKEYIEDLTKSLISNYNIHSESISLKLELEDMFVLIDLAIPLGLILNEMISNVFKHAYSDKRKLELIIRLYKEKDDTMNIQVCDNGVGIPKDIDLNNVNSIGVQTIFNLIKYQLKGQIRYDTDNGMKWHIKLKDNNQKVRV